ncbi:hypothetical conserved integral membrane protein [Streptomyces camponoticapitis]|uniref:Hypothetical conserved integral membrane protein n=1 Tax=Streptomyces camponoticapitis TaxID=1616125 RepID=A0ABQ2E2M9_9ACTN|nr:hypothetical protein [Streptomyces camponoticapitis]GGJ86394.1 hypothetical conserved integral membrane protein [Streptomyces camponoticapitis]
MTKLLLSIHVLASILVVGPIAVAASLFPRYVRLAGEDGRSAGAAALLHRICGGYAIVGVAVPVFGLATGAQLGVLTDIWLITSIVLTSIAAAILALAILPGQEKMIETSGAGAPAGETSRAAARLAGLTGVFNLLWAVVVVLMIVRPGSTTGA